MKAPSLAIEGGSQRKNFLDSLGAMAVRPHSSSTVYLLILSGKSRLSPASVLLAIVVGCKLIVVKIRLHRSVPR